MSILPRKLVKLGLYSIINRNLHSSSIHTLYDGEGKTTITVLNKNFDYGLMINNITEHGFILNNGIRAIGPMIALSKFILSWNIASSSDMNKEAFSLILHLEPRLDMLVIGLDDEYPHDAPFILNIKNIFRNHKIPLEVLPVYHACSTFNFLNSENRYVAAALIPPKSTFADFILQDKIKFSKSEQGEQIKKMSNCQNNKILSTSDFDCLNVEKSAKNKEIKEYFKVRRPWEIKKRCNKHIIG